ncbi:MAG: transcriptional regulator, MarR family [Caulobacteraceae bacterium]|jgi:DNA-binding MarR family transcriptional regulator|nr:transcriptional regulator, MarR family [Caulobacteraceae bacterium]
MVSTPNQVRTSATIATYINWLSNRLISSASATYGQLNIGFVEARLIYLLGRRPQLTAARCAEIIGADPGAVSRALKALKSSGLIHAAGGKSRTLSLTDTGLQLCEKVAAISDERERRLLQGLEPAQADQLLSCLETMLANMPDVVALAGEATG